MTTERDSDRRLRSWLSDGAERAPERFVWAALDEIERLPQRSGWRVRLEGGLARVRPASVALVAAAAVLIAAVAVLRVAPPDVPTPGRAFTMADLPEIVVWDDTKPAAWTLDNLVSNPDEIVRIPIRSMSETELNQLQQPLGYFGGRYTNFAGSRGGLYMSWSAVFVNETLANASLDFYRNELESADGWGYGPGVPVDLGEGGFLYSGSTTSFSGPPGTDPPVPSPVYLWRNDNLLLAIGGWYEFDAAELLSAAEGMDARADSIRD